MAVSSDTLSRVNAEMRGGTRAELGEPVGLGGEAAIGKEWRLSRSGVSWDS